MKKVLMTASESSHFKNFHTPYIKYLQSRGTSVYTASNGVFGLEGVPHTTLGFRKKIISPANIAVIFKLARLIRKERFDAVYTNSTLAGFVGRMAVILSGSRKTSCRHICHGYLFDDDGSMRSRVYLAFEKLVRRRTDLLAVMNADDLKIAEKYSLGREIVFLNGMGLPAEKFPALPMDEISELRNDLGARDGETLFLCVGEFSARKNQSAMIRALAKTEHGRLIFAGDGELLDECKTLAESLGVSDRTVFLGHYNNVNALYRACDCLISASRYEGLPFNVMEALYCGERVLLSDVKGNRDLAEDKRSLYPYNDAERLARLMETTEQLPEGKLPERYLLENAFPENIEKLQFP